MAKEPPTTPPDEAEGDAPEAPEGTEGEAPAGPGRDSAQIAEQGLAIDVPYEAPPGDATGIRYADDLPDEKGWAPPDGFKIAGVPFEEVVAGIGQERGDTPRIHSRGRQQTAGDGPRRGGQLRQLIRT